MTSLDQKRQEYRSYLEKCGAIDCLTQALIKLYETKERPDDACKFIRKNLCPSCPDEEDFEKLTADLSVANQKICQLETKLKSLEGVVKRSNSEVQLALESGFQGLVSDAECNSLLKKHLTVELFNSLKELKTENKTTLLDCIQSGLQHHDAGVGCYAPEATAYTVFSDLFDPIIEDYHGFAKDDQHPLSDWGDASTFADLDPENEYIVSTRVRCGRNLSDFPFHPLLSEAQYLEIMEKVKTVLNGLDGYHSGTLYPLEGMEKDVEQQLIADNFLFVSGDKYLESASACRFWPVGRAIFMNPEKTFLVWVNEEDQLRFISMEKGGDLGAVYQRLKDGVEKLSKDLSFAVSERLGYLTFCPTNLGTTIRASVNIKLPKLGADLVQLDALVAKFDLQIRGTHGEHTPVEGSVYNISNKRRLGLTEYDAVKQMYDGLTEIIKAEKEL